MIRRLTPIALLLAAGCQSPSPPPDRWATWRTQVQGAPEDDDSVVTIDAPGAQLNPDAADEDASTPPGTAAVRTGRQSWQRYCPITPSDEVDTRFWLVHQGQRIYFCSHQCEEFFRQDPDRYLDALEALPENRLRRRRRDGSRTQFRTLGNP